MYCTSSCKGLQSCCGQAWRELDSTMGANDISNRVLSAMYRIFPTGLPWFSPVSYRSLFVFLTAPALMQYVKRIFGVAQRLCERSNDAVAVVGLGQLHPLFPLMF